MADAVQELRDIANFRMAVGRDEILERFDAADFRDFSGHFDGRKYPAFSGLRSLAQLQLEHAHLFERGDFGEL